MYPTNKGTGLDISLAVWVTEVSTGLVHRSNVPCQASQSGQARVKHTPAFHGAPCDNPRLQTYTQAAAGPMHSSLAHLHPCLHASIQAIRSKLLVPNAARMSGFTPSPACRGGQPR